MSSQLIEKHRDGAEIYHDDPALAYQKFHEMLAEISIPACLFPLEVVEFGYNRAAGFIWIKHKKKEQYTFKKSKKVVSYDAEVSAFVEKSCLRNITGIKYKVVLWISLSDIFIEDPSSGQIMFRTSSGLTGSAPVSDFENIQEC